MLRTIACLLFVFCLPAFPADTPWTWTDIEGRSHAPFASTNTHALVLVFIDVDCPVANYFLPELRRIAAEAEPRGAHFVFVHPDPERSVAAARKHAKDYDIRGPVVLDPKQATALRLLAEVTPEAFVITPDGQVRYRGRVNDMFLRPSKKRVKPRTHDLRDALQAVLDGTPVKKAKTKAVGCYIHFKRPGAGAARKRR